MMQSLDKDLRSALEKTVKAARTVAETAANAAVDQLGVGLDKPEAFLGNDEKALRNRLRTHGKQLGDTRDSNSTNPTYGKQEVQHLVQEVAYQHWHRMLFARFLADNNLLMYDGVSVTIEECEELAPDEGSKNGWELAGKLAARMLPQVFKPRSPVFELTFAPEHQSELERLLKDLPVAVFKASDSLGWVYQYWQADNKDRINKSEVKIGADELPAVTQLFTEPYMVAFLLHNSIGAWWATRHPGKQCPINLDNLRNLDDGTPAAGKFEGWPDSLADFKLLDPCCGSGHFLVAAFLMLVPIRINAEGLSAKEAINRVLVENIHGLEIDPRCVEIAVFAVALEAWRYPGANGKPLGVREIPLPHIACCGLKVSAKVQDWEELVPNEALNAQHLREGLARLHRLFAQAPVLGSLLSPSKDQGDLFGAEYRELSELLQLALAGESAGNASNPYDAERWDSTLSALGLLDAASLLNIRYNLVITNVPYLGIRKQDELLRSYCQTHYELGRHDLAAAFMLRIHELTEIGGVALAVSPASWLQSGSYEGLRRHILDAFSLRLIAKLGVGAFDAISGEVVNVILTITECREPNQNSEFTGIDAEQGSGALGKAEKLRTSPLIRLSQVLQLKNPDARILLSTSTNDNKLLAEFAESLAGIQNGDSPRFLRKFWEISVRGDYWSRQQVCVNEIMDFGGCDTLIAYDMKEGHLRESREVRRERLHDSDQRGKSAWGKTGVLVSRMGNLPATIYAGTPFDQNAAIILPRDESNTAAIFAFCKSPQYVKAVRDIDSKLNVTSATLSKVPFDLDYWRQIASEQYPQGLPKPYSDDPTQWWFHGHPQPATAALQVAVARLVGFAWPAESDEKMDISDKALGWIARSRLLALHTDTDGIVCIPPVGRESSASDRLRNLLADAYGEGWSNDVLNQLLVAAAHGGNSLETWLREKFFTQHCALFGNRPFVWHIWDGLRDGFSALLNYHKLDYKMLEALIYTYLGDWIARQKRDADSGVDGAQEKQAAAEVLKRRLELILAGEAPYDIFARWKSIENQPIGWNPDPNDGVRINIRPFLSVPDVGKRGAGILRDKPNIKWDKDRGSDMPSAPWYELGVQYGGKLGDRINDHHLSLDDKLKAREKAK